MGEAIKSEKTNNDMTLVAKLFHMSDDGVQYWASKEKRGVISYDMKRGYILTPDPRDLSRTDHVKGLFAYHEEWILIGEDDG